MAYEETMLNCNDTVPVNRIDMESNETRRKGNQRDYPLREVNLPGMA